MKTLYSDPYLKALRKDRPKEAKEYFELISNSAFKNDLAFFKF